MAILESFLPGWYIPKIHFVQHLELPMPELEYRKANDWAWQLYPERLPIWDISDIIPALGPKTSVLGTNVSKALVDQPQFYHKFVV